MKYIVFAGIILLAGCNSPKEQKSAKFHAFLKKFDLLKLPLKMDPRINIRSDSADPLPDVIASAGDSLFIDSLFTALDHSHSVKAYGMLPDTDSCYHLIFLMPADNYQPCLVTYTKTGEQIGEDMISVGKCGPDECDSCNENTIIRRNYSVYAADTIWELRCDSDRPLGGLKRIYILYKTGKINHKGKSVFSGEKEKTLQ